MAIFKCSHDVESALDNLEGDLALTIRPSGNKAFWMAEVSGGGFIFEGRNLIASDSDPNLFGGGRVTSVEMVDDDGGPVIAITGLHASAVGMMDAFEAAGSLGIFYYMARGDDTVVGGKEGEYLIAGGGDDVMTGHAGSDRFEFQAMGLSGRNVRPVVAEHDVITDFDTKGADADILGLHQAFTYRAINHCDDIRLDFEDGSTLVLEGVKKAAFTHYLGNFDF